MAPGRCRRGAIVRGHAAGEDDRVQEAALAEPTPEVTGELVDVAVGDQGIRATTRQPIPPHGLQPDNLFAGQIPVGSPAGSHPQLI